MISDWDCARQEDGGGDLLGASAPQAPMEPAPVYGYESTASLNPIPFNLVPNQKRK